MVHRIYDESTTTGVNVMDMDVMDDHVLHELDSDAGTISDANIGSPSINGFVAGHDQLLMEPNDHAACKDNPEGPILGNSMAEGSGLGIH